MTYDDHISKFRHLKLADGNMTYIDEGSGPAILLVHGVPSSSWLYRHIIPMLTEQGFRVICPDMLGYGQSDKPEDPELYTPEKMGKRLLSLMSELAIDTWAQVFHDGGGLWTWEMLRIDASRVNHLFMLNTLVYEEGFKPPMRFDEGFIAKCYVGLYAKPWSQFIVINPTFKNGVEHKKVITPEVLIGYKRPFRNQSTAAIYYFFTQTCHRIPDYTALHKSLDIDVTVIWGKHDQILRWEGNEEQALSNLQLSKEDIHLLDAGHFIQEEQPQQISDIIVNTLQAV